MFNSIEDFSTDFSAAMFILSTPAENFWTDLPFSTVSFLLFILFPSTVFVLHCYLYILSLTYRFIISLFFLFINCCALLQFIIKICSRLSCIGYFVSRPNNLSLSSVLDVRTLPLCRTMQLCTGSYRPTS